MSRNYSIYGIDRIEKLAEKFQLPYWWVEGVFVEYFNCRKFFVDGELWTFDFNLVDEKEIATIPEKKIIIPGHFIAQNIQPKDLGRRTALSTVGSPTAALKKEIIFPEGKLNETAFPFLGNNIVIWDWKLNLHSHVVVSDSDDLYYWKIAELEKGMYKSKLFDSTKLESIYYKLIEIRTQENFQNPTKQLRQTADALYTELENARKSVRDFLWDYHLKRKNESSTSELVTTTPPKLTEFDVISVENGKHVVHTHLEPLLYRAALRNYKLCKKIHEQSQGHDDVGQDILEIEYSIMTVVAIIGCLESYINYVIKEKGTPDHLKIQDLSKKWKVMAKLLNNNVEVFGENTPPFSDFKKIIRWRNKVMHNKIKFLAPIGAESTTSAIFTYENAKKSILVSKAMIIKFCATSDLTEPRWIGELGGSGGYWDETFTDLDLV